MILENGTKLRHCPSGGRRYRPHDGAVELLWPAARFAQEFAPTRYGGCVPLAKQTLTVTKS